MVAGATGLVGQALVKQLLADTDCSHVHALARRASLQATPKLTTHVVDFTKLGPLPPVDTLLIALGTTIKLAGSKDAFRAVDFDAVIAVARMAHANGARAVGMVSAMGASANSSVFYSRTKGEVEDAVKSIGFERIVIARPSFIGGDRAALKQADRPGEGLALVAMRLFGPLIPSNYRTVDADTIAASLIQQTRAPAVGTLTLLPGELALAAKR